MNGQEKTPAALPPAAADLTRTEDEARTADASRGVPYAQQALRAIEGECKAAQYLARMHAQQAAPDELAIIVSMLYGASLRGFCRVIEKALRGVRHG